MTGMWRGWGQMLLGCGGDGENYYGNGFQVFGYRVPVSLSSSDPS